MAPLLRVYLKYISIFFVLIFFFHSTSFALGGPGLVAAIESRDSDNDGVLDEQDRFPFDAAEWFDSDKDKIGDNADPDDDNDRMPDEWEVYFGLNPFLGDASNDPDNDGLSNLDEYLADTDPTRTDTFPAQNSAPEIPELDLPVDGYLDGSLQPELRTKGFSDPDPGDAHLKTIWQISREPDFSELVLERESRSRLTSVTVPNLILSAETEYFWRAKFYDTAHAESGWSETYSYTTGPDTFTDNNANHVADAHEADDRADTDQDGTLDIDQDDLLSLHNPELDIVLGVKGYVNVVDVESIMFADLTAIPDLDHVRADIPVGLISFKIEVENPGDVITLKVYFSEPAPANAAWYKYDSFSGLHDFSDHIIFTPDRMAATLQLKDGGPGDDDGIENGTIIDPSGLWIPRPVQRTTSDSIVEAASGGSGGCFIQTISR